MIFAVVNPVLKLRVPELILDAFKAVIWALAEVNPVDKIIIPELIFVFNKFDTENDPLEIFNEFTSKFPIVELLETKFIIVAFVEFKTVI